MNHAVGVLGVFEVKQGWEMPDQLAVGLIILASLSGLVALLLALHILWVWLRPLWKRCAPHINVSWGDEPNPLQWLINEADRQKGNPSKHIVLQDSIWFSYTRNEVKPCFKMRLYYKYFGVYNLLVGMPEGRVIYKGEQLPDSIQLGEGKTNVAPEGAIIYDLDIYIPEKFKQDMLAEVGAGEIRNLNLSMLKAKVQIKNNSEVITWSIAPEKMIIRRNG